MHCDEVWRLISDADGQPVRSPRVRAHLRRCGACTAFAGAIPERRAQLRALAPMLPSVAASGVLARALGAGATHGSDGAGLASSGAGKAVGTAILAKVSAVGLAATAAVGVTVALKHHGPPAHRSSPATRSAERAAPRPDSRTGTGGPSSLALPGLTSLSDLLGAGHRSAARVNNTALGHRPAAVHGRAARGSSRPDSPRPSGRHAARGDHVAGGGRAAAKRTSNSPVSGPHRPSASAGNTRTLALPKCCPKRDKTFAAAGHRLRPQRRPPPSEIQLGEAP